MSTDKSHPHQHVIRSATVIGIATFCSRILGFIRDIVIARLFGVYVYAQAFVVAFKIPNLLRDFVGEGAANAAIVPVFSEYSSKRSPEEFWELANVVLNLLLIILASLTILGIIFSPVLIRLIAPGFVFDPEKLAMTIRLNRIIFPYCLLVCLAAYAMAILNSLKHFSVPAFAPCLLNISIIVFAIIFGEEITGLSMGVLVGGALQLLVQIPVLYKKGFRLQLFRRFSHPAATEIGRLLLPRLFSSGIYQLNNFVDSIFGSLAWIVGDGAVAALYFGYRLVLFPLGIFSNSLAQALLPTFSRQALEDNKEKLKNSLSFGLRASFFAIIPASAAFIALSGPIIFTIFQGGRFDDYSCTITARVLFFYSIGLFAYASNKILQSCFFALKDTITPTKIAALTLAINILLNLLLIFPMKISGVALATSVSGIITTLILFGILKKKLFPFEAGRIYLSFLRICLASFFMALTCWAVSTRADFLQSTMISRWANLFFLIFIGFISYVGFCFVFRVRELHELWRWLLNRRSG